MAYFEPAIIGMLKSDPGVSAIVAGRIHPFTGPQAVARPKLTFQRISTVREESNDGPTYAPSARLQIDCWADDLATAKRLADAVRLCLDGFRGIVAGVQLDHIHLIDETDIPTPVQPGQEAAVQRVSCDYSIQWQEPPPDA